MKHKPLPATRDARYMLACIPAPPIVAPQDFVLAHDQAIVAQVMEDDRQWFLAHPGRTHRIRPCVIGELPYLCRAVLVRTFGPNNRARQGVAIGCADIARLHRGGVHLFDLDDTEIMHTDWRDIPATNDPIWPD